MTGISINIHVTTPFFVKVNILTEIKQEFKEEHISQFAIAKELYFEITLLLVSAPSTCKRKYIILVK